MKIEHPLSGTIFNNPIKLAVGMSHTRSNPASLGRTVGKVGLTCPMCEIAFERYACWVKRVLVNYCSKACANEAKRRPVPVVCVMCGDTYTSTPSMVHHARTATCSDACMRAHRRDLKLSGVLLPGQYRATRDSGSRSSKLTELQAQEIAASVGMTVATAQRYGVSRTTVVRLRRVARGGKP